MFFIGVCNVIFVSSGGEVAVSFPVESPRASLSESIEGEELIDFIIYCAEGARFYSISDIITVDSVLAARVESVSWAGESIEVEKVSIN